MRQVLEDIQHFPALLPVVQKGLDAVEADLPAKRIERILSSDPITVARILRLANSAYFGVMSEVRTVSMAVGVIGFRKLRSLLRSILVGGLIELLAQGRPGTVKVRKRAIAVSAAAHEVAICCRVPDPEELLVAGLLHNIGEMALFWSYPHKYDKVLEWSPTLTALRKAQRSVFGVDSQEVGRQVLEAWNFPVIFRQIAARWPEPLSEARDEHLRLSLTVVFVSVNLAEAMMGGTDPAALQIGEDYRETLKISGSALRKIQAELPEKIIEIQNMLAD